jgi:hypothetical protein
MAKKIALVCLTSLVVSSTVGYAQTNINGTINTITTAVPFLRITPDCRSGGMGDAGIAISADANAQYWNVGKMPFAPKKSGVSFSYTPWLHDIVPDISLMYLSGYTKFGENNNQVISGSLRYFSLGDINFTDINATPTGTGKPREYSFDLGYSRKLSDNLSTGVSLRYIHSAITTGLSGSQATDTKPGNAFAADWGIYYTKNYGDDPLTSSNLSLGAAISNLGSKISYSSTRKDYIPANLGIGAAYTKGIDEYNKVTFALDFNKLLVPTPLVATQDSLGNPTSYYIPNKSVVAGVLGSFSDAPGGMKEELREVQISAGTEYWYQNQFAIRAGYFYEDRTKGDRKYATFGIGVKMNVLTINGSYLVASGSGVNRNPLANTFRFTLSFDFDKIEQQQDEETKTE